MIWKPTIAEVLALVLLLSMFLNFWQFVRGERIRRVARASIEKAFADRNDFCRIPRNQMIELFKLEGVYELLRPASEFKGKPSALHPMQQAPSKRRKLRG